MRWVLGSQVGLYTSRKKTNHQEKDTCQAHAAAAFNARGHCLHLYPLYRDRASTREFNKQFYWFEARVVHFVKILEFEISKKSLHWQEIISSYNKDLRRYFIMQYTLLHQIRISPCFRFPFLLASDSHFSLRQIHSLSQICIYVWHCAC